jgi:homoserine kinase
MTDTVRIRVPATSANLGPGFDALGLALALYDDVEATVTDSGIRVAVEGEGAGDLPTDERHLVARAVLAGFARLGAPAPGLRIRCVNRIPQARGLGSSAAAIVAGLLIAKTLAPQGTSLDLVALSGELEGHADNVAACVLGGLTIAWRDTSGFRATRVTPAPELMACVFVPPARSATAETRRLLPVTVAHTDAAHAAGRSALLVTALSGRPELLLPATEDLLHQQYRRDAMPDSVNLVETLRKAGCAAVISGAGPTVLCLTAGSDDTVVKYCPTGWECLELAVDTAGATCI